MDMLKTLGIAPVQLVINIVAFVILYWMLRKVLFAPITRVLEERAERVAADRDEAAQLRAQAATTQATLDQRLSNIEAEARDRIQAAEREAQAARELMLNEARAQQEKIVAAGVAELGREREKLLAEMRNLVADLSMTAAAKIIGRDLDDTAHRKLIDEIVESIAP